MAIQDVVNNGWYPPPAVPKRWSVPLGAQSVLIYEDAGAFSWKPWDDWTELRGGAGLCVAIPRGTKHIFTENSTGLQFLQVPAASVPMPASPFPSSTLLAALVGTGGVTGGAHQGKATIEAAALAAGAELAVAASAGRTGVNLWSPAMGYLNDAAVPVYRWSDSHSGGQSHADWMSKLIDVRSYSRVQLTMRATSPDGSGGFAVTPGLYGYNRFGHQVLNVAGLPLSSWQQHTTIQLGAPYTGTDAPNAGYFQAYRPEYLLLGWTNGGAMLVTWNVSMWLVGLRG